MRISHLSETVIDLNFYRDWLAKREAAREESTEKSTFFVTVSREFGCKGYGLAEKLVEKLSKESGEEWSLFTRQMIEELVASEELEQSMIYEVSAERWKFKDWLVDALVPDYRQSPSSNLFG